MGVLIHPRRPNTLPTGGAILREPYARGLVAAFAPGVANYGLTDLVSGLKLTPVIGAALSTAGGTVGLACGADGAFATCPSHLKITTGAITMIARLAFSGTPSLNASLFAVTANNTNTSPFVAYAFGVDGSGFLRLGYSNGGTFVSWTGGASYRRSAVIGTPLTMIGLFTASGATIYFGPDEGALSGTVSNPSYSATSEVTIGFGTPNVCVEYGLIYNRRLIPSELKLFRDDPYHWLRPSAAQQFALGTAPPVGVVASSPWLHYRQQMNG